MTIAARGPVSMTTLLALGRISNLPTVWTNTLAGIVLAGGDWRNWRFGTLLVAMSLFYIGGMYLNDYFDRAIDARERPERPIPSGAIPGGAVSLIGFGLLVVGLVVTATMGAAAVAIALLLGAAIVAYDCHHKDNPLAPIVMGACRALVYGTATVGVGGHASPLVIVAAVAVGAYVAGLTYAARQESLEKVGNLWPLLLVAAPIAVAIPALQYGLGPIAIYLSLVAWIAAALNLLVRRPVPGSVSRAVGRLIAGISLCDAGILASIGATAPAMLAVAGFLATLTAHKYIAGT